MLLAKRAKLQDAAGMLSVHPLKLSWQALQAPGPPELHIGLISITNTQRAKGKPLLRLTAGTSAHMFEFDSEGDRDEVVEAYTKAKEQLTAEAKARESQAASAAASQAGPSTAGSQALGTGLGGGGGASQRGGCLAWSGPLPTDAQKREIILADPEVGERYNALVAAAGALTDEEFWASVMAERARAAATAVTSAPAGASTAASAASAGSGAKASGAKTSAMAKPDGPAAVAVLPPVQGQAEQRRGLSNAMFQVPVEQDGRSVAMRFTLTPDLIAMLFAEKPHVRRAFLRAVPADMSEKEFWTRYIKHEMAKEERRKRAMAAGPSGADDASSDAQAQPEHARMFEEGEGAGRGDHEGGGPGGRRVRRRGARAADPTVDLEADVGDGLPAGFGLLHGASKEPVARGGFRAMAEELARDINRHATVVLAGARALQPAPHGGQPGTSGASTSGQAPGPSGGDGDGALDELAAARLRGYGAGLEDLRAPVAQRVEALRITAPGAYFGGRAGGGDDGGGEGGRAEGRRAQAAQAAQGQQGAGGAAGGGGGCVAALRLLSSVDPNNLPCPPVPSFSAYEALLDVCGLTAEDGAGGPGGGPPPGLAQPPDAVLAPQLLAKFRTQVKMVADVARHFWSCVPEDTLEKRQKAERLASHVDCKLWPELDHAIATANRMGGPQRPYVRQLLTPALRMMEVMLERHKLEVEQGPGRGGRGGRPP